jgi:hypothetical protein
VGPGIGDVEVGGEPRGAAGVGVVAGVDYDISVDCSALATSGACVNGGGGTTPHLGGGDGASSCGVFCKEVRR